MKIVNLKEFLKMPEETLFCKYAPTSFDFPSIFLERGGEIDFFYQNLDNIDCKSSDERFLILIKAQEGGEHFKMDYDCSGRDGSFDNDQLFVVYEKEDIEQLIERLKKCIK